MQTIDLTPDQVKQAADSAQSNLSRKQEPNDILKLLEEQKIKNPGFEAMVEQQEKNLLVAANFRPPQLWVTPEPGAGLIRDQPELIAVTELYAYPGRGGALVYELDDAGNRIPDPDADKHKDADDRGPPQEAKPAWAGGGAEEDGRGEEEGGGGEEARARRGSRRWPSSAGGGRPKKEEAAAEAAGGRGPDEGEDQGIRWVAITGVLNYKALRDTYLLALKRPEVAYPALQAARRRTPGQAVRRLVVRLGGGRPEPQPARSSTTCPRRTRNGRPRRCGSAPWSPRSPSSRPASGNGSTSAAWSPPRSSRSPSRCRSRLVRRGRGRGMDVPSPPRWQRAAGPSAHDGHARRAADGDGRTAAGGRANRSTSRRSPMSTRS